MRTRQSVIGIVATAAAAIAGTAGAQGVVANPVPNRPARRRDRARSLHRVSPAGLPATLTVVSGDSLCTAEVPQPGAAQGMTLRFQVTNLGPGRRRPFIHFTATHGKLSPDSARIGSDGTASTIWFRSGGSDTVSVGASVVTDWGTASRLVRLTPAKAPSKATYQVVVATGGFQHGYEKAQLRYPLVVEVLRSGTTDSIITKADDCSPLRVVFRRAGTAGAVTPDTSLAVIQGSWRQWRTESGELRGDRGSREGCFARANWTLAEGPGFQDTRAAFVVGDGTAVAGAPAVFQAIGGQHPSSWPATRPSGISVPRPGGGPSTDTGGGATPRGHHTDVPRYRRTPPRHARGARERVARCPRVRRFVCPHPCAPGATAFSA
jgi:hypothetical protein